MNLLMSVMCMPCCILFSTINMHGKGNRKMWFSIKKYLLPVINLNECLFRQLHCCSYKWAPNSTSNFPEIKKMLKMVKIQIKKNQSNQHISHIIKILVTLFRIASGLPHIVWGGGRALRAPSWKTMLEHFWALFKVYP